MIVDTGQHIGEPGVRIDAVELGGLDWSVNEGSALPAAFGTGEEPCAAAKCNSAQRSLGRVVRQADGPSSRKRVKAGQRFSM